ncbi:MAG: cobalamin B12-binding domain-containing protein [Alphaproteobacteria bacterium]|nr:cobalamin B12-binding domain-containing protein [Alphaproteobacteria bacterium]MCB9792301.1 cobalamin B12-binding domain-containing protein [Alphaproteobacteria bacterium]
MSITLINPPEKLRVWAGISESMAYGVYCFPPLGLMYIQAAIEKYTPFKAEIYDGVVDDLDHADFDRGLAQYDLDVVGISAYTHSLPDVQMTINNVRKRNPNAHIVLGGPHPIMFPEYAIQLEGVDSIVVGDGDDAVVDIVEALDQGRSLEGIGNVWFKGDDGTIVKNGARKETRDLSWQIWPDRARSRFRDYWVPGSKQPLVTTAVTSRGCPHSCPFCFTYKKQYRVRDIENILDEMEHCVSLGITEVFFIDDLFTPNSQWAIKFCDGIERRGLKFSWGYKTTIAGTTREQIRRCREAGATKMHFGVETMTNEGLEVHNKHCDTDDCHRVFRWCREEGIRSVAYIMIGGPAERTREDVLHNLDEALKLDPDYAAFAIYTPYPGTETFDEGAKKGLFPSDCWDRLMKDPLCGVKVPVCWEEHLSAAELLDLLKICHRKFYFRPRFIARQMLNLESGSEFRRLASSAMQLVRLELTSAASHEAPT